MTIQALTWASCLLVSASAKPVKVYILAGQSNMVGEGSIEHLDLLIDTKSCTCNKYKSHLWSGTGYATKTNVYAKFGPHEGLLTVDENNGYAAQGHFGPEVMFGWTVGDALPEETILLLKTAYGGRSLAVDFRPPLSGEGDPSWGIPPSHYGWQYREMINEIRDGLANLKQFIPAFDDADGYELEAFVWFQGWNDLCERQKSFVTEYYHNLMNLILDVRRELGNDDLPVIIGESGQHGYLNDDMPETYAMNNVRTVREAQEGVTLLPQFQNNTKFVTTHEFVVYGPNETQYDGIHHFWGRADTYFEIGRAFGKAALALIGLEPQELAEEVCNPCTNDSRNIRERSLQIGPA